MKGEFVCVVCPNGCLIEAEFTEQKPPRLLNFSGQQCQRGASWIKQEIENPMRTFSTNVLVKNGVYITASVRTTKPVPLGLVMPVLGEIRKIRAEAPLRIGQVLLSHPAGADTDIIVTRHVDKV